jgi:hypothetical protein
MIKIKIINSCENGGSQQHFFKYLYDILKNHTSKLEKNE